MLKTSGDHVLGNGELELVEYGDYACTDCREAYQFIEKWQRELGSSLTFIFRQMPLDQLYPIHPEATLAAQATEAADKQGRFWEMHSAIFGTTEQLSEELFLNLAEKIGLDMDKFTEDFESSDVLERVNQGVKEGQERGVSSTPTFFLNGERIEDSKNYSQVFEYIKGKLT